MELREYFDIGLAMDAYKRLLSKDQLGLHEVYERRATIDEVAIVAIRGAGASSVLVITEPWCGDSLAIFPVVSKLFMAAGCDVRVIQRDEHKDLIDLYLTNGGRAIPIVIVLDDEFNELFHWGPRPAPAQAIVDKHKAAVATGEMERADLYKKVRAFYARDHGKAVVAEFVARSAE